MELFLVLIPVTLALVVLSLWAFVWSARNEQFDDLDRQAWSILFDDARTPQKQDPHDTASDAKESPQHE